MISKSLILNAPSEQATMNGWVRKFSNFRKTFSDILTLGKIAKGCTAPVRRAGAFKERVNRDEYD